MQDEQGGGGDGREAPRIEGIRVELPSRLVEAARAVVARRAGGGPVGPASLDALIAEALRRYLQLEATERSLRADGDGHTPDGWYD